MIDFEQFTLAQQTVVMGQSPAFGDMLDGIRADSEQLRSRALDLTLTYAERRNAFHEWSAHSAVVKAMEETIENAARAVAAYQEEIDIERANERERSARTNWTA